MASRPTKLRINCKDEHVYRKGLINITHLTAGRQRLVADDASCANGWDALHWVAQRHLPAPRSHTLQQDAALPFRAFRTCDVLRCRHNRS